MEFIINSPTIGQISEALAKAQGMIGNALKDSANPFFKSKYADLSAITEVSKKPLSDNNLMFSCSVVPDNGMYYLVATLSHVSGEWLRSYMPLIVEKPDMQKLGAAISYSRRYALSSLCHIATEDDDGESLVDRSSGEIKQKTLTDAQKSYIASLSSKWPKEKLEVLLKSISLDSLENVSPEKFNSVLALLKAGPK